MARLCIPLLSLFLLTSHATTTRCLPGLTQPLPELSTFLSLLNSSVDLCSQTQRGGRTILAPTNNAFAAANVTLGNSTTASPDIQALLSYHVLQTQHSAAAFSSDTCGNFFSTLLEDRTYTNNTGGQVVESCNGSILSGMYHKSNIMTGDIFYTGGFIHSIDAVLQIPQRYADVVTAADLSDYVALGTHTQLTTPEMWSSTIEVWYSADTTVFAPNSPQYSTNYTGWDNLTLAQDLEIWQYHIVNTSVLFSSDLTNGTTFTTSAGLPVTAWQDEAGELFINDAKVIERDLLHANGVIQILDRPLDPNNTHVRPAALDIEASRTNAGASSSTTNVSDASPSASSTPSTPSLSRTAKIAIIASTVAVCVIIAAALICWFCFRRRRTIREIRSRDGQRRSLVQPSNVWHDPLEMSSETATAEMATHHNMWEIDGSRQRRSRLEMPAVLQHMGRRRAHELP